MLQEPDNPFLYRWPHRPPQPDTADPRWVSGVAHPNPPSPVPRAVNVPGPRLRSNTESQDKSRSFWIPGFWRTAWLVVSWARVLRRRSPACPVPRLFVRRGARLVRKSARRAWSVGRRLVGSLSLSLCLFFLFFFLCFFVFRFGTSWLDINQLTG